MHKNPSKTLPGCMKNEEEKVLRFFYVAKIPILPKTCLNELRVVQEKKIYLTHQETLCLKIVYKTKLENCKKLLECKVAFVLKLSHP